MLGGSSGEGSSGASTASRGVRCGRHGRDPGRVGSALVGRGAMLRTLVARHWQRLVPGESYARSRVLAPHRLDSRPCSRWTMPLALPPLTNRRCWQLSRPPMTWPLRRDRSALGLTTFSAGCTVAPACFGKRPHASRRRCELTPMRLPPVTRLRSWTKSARSDSFTKGPSSDRWRCRPGERWIAGGVPRALYRTLRVHADPGSSPCPSAPAARRDMMGDG